MSAQYCVAMALKQRAATLDGLREFDDPAMMRLVGVTEVLGEDAIPNLGARVELTTRRRSRASAATDPRRLHLRLGLGRRGRQPGPDGAGDRRRPATASISSSRRRPADRAARRDGARLGCRLPPRWNRSPSTAGPHRGRECSGRGGLGCARRDQLDEHLGARSGVIWKLGVDSTTSSTSPSKRRSRVRTWAGVPASANSSTIASLTAPTIASGRGRRTRAASLGLGAKPQAANSRRRT